MTERAAPPRWITETCHDELGFRTSLSADRVLLEERTEHQQLIVFENAHFGRVLMLDGAVQLTTSDEFVYHEMMAHVPIIAHGAAARVLIIGGGDGGVAREVLKHRSVEHLTMVEIDQAVVDFCRAHFPEVSTGAFDDRRMRLLIQDGIAYARAGGEHGERYDLVIVDSTDPVGPAAGLFTPAFHADCRKLLRPGGILVTQSGAPFLQRDELVGTISSLAGSFADATCYLSAVPTYTGGFLAHGFATDGDARTGTTAAELAERHAAAAITTRYYSPAVHAAAFALPVFIAEAVREGRESPPTEG